MTFIIENLSILGPFARSGVPILHKKFPPFRENAGTSFSTNLIRTAVKITGIYFYSCDLSGVLSTPKKTELFFWSAIESAFLKSSNNDLAYDDIVAVVGRDFQSSSVYCS
jgi:hypothetical protein